MTSIQVKWTLISVLYHGGLSRPLGFLNVRDVSAWVTKLERKSSPLASLRKPKYQTTSFRSSTCTLMPLFRLLN
ncbi:uncharacterized protein BDR25DRAFT_363211 [Lindgomyces ingoldianus]|uniref:Uncharacterized protein n=1 Tax=Lindgomyces ingoldianus TaxID=673940 RepID=A0ACB6Q8V0_9PLEO|nr:uncharacterized protein BDR25DRAFT_363211 [Lindgomyces ingoldianus]KAF2463013.1 hypothetical protein BDR25DRAFT_363211 [Lindgomyces ingoldianus]